VVSDTIPFADDPTRAIGLLREALVARGPPEESARPWRSALEQAVASGSAHGFLYREGGNPVGLAVWDPTSPVGATVEVAYLAGGARGTEGYRALFRTIAERSGGVAFAPGGLAGLSDPEEQALMRGLGFGRFARSEMRLPPESVLPSAAADAARPFRTARPTDEAALVALHRIAYDGQFDQYLFLADRDPDRDAESAIRELLGGRWGDFLPWASPIAEGDDGPSGAVIVVRAPYGPLIADVMVDPHLQGRGIGRRLMVECIRLLRDRGESVIVLNVTEGNSRAVRLYEALGFVRSLGPSYGWYSRALIPVSSGID
jgi:ribosomal protein S18 acetylase RimI-like enzyme